MQQEELKSLFDQQAASYDQQWAKLAPLREMERPARIQFLASIAQRMRPDGILVNSDLCFDLQSEHYASLSAVWLRMMAGAEVPPEAIDRMRAAYGRDVALLPAEEIEAMLNAAGFAAPIQFFRAGLIGAWYSRRAEVL